MEEKHDLSDGNKINMSGKGKGREMKENAANMKEGPLSKAG